MNEFYSAVSQYIESKDSMSEKTKAEAEAKLWEQWKSSGDKRFFTRREWAQTNFKFPVFEFEFRAQLLQAGPWVDPLWKLVDERMPRYVAVRIFRKTRVAVAKEQISHEEALQREINRYNSTGHIVHTKEGRVYRKRTPDEKFRSSNPSFVEVEMNMEGTQNTRSKQFMTRITALSEEYLRTSIHELSDLDSMTIKMAKDEFISIVRESVEDFRRKIGVMRQQSKQDRIRAARITRSVLQEASEVLGISIVYGSDVELRKAKKIMLRRCAQLHPDKAGPMSDQQKSEYTAVVAAYKTLETYMEGRRSDENGERNYASK